MRCVILYVRDAQEADCFLVRGVRLEDRGLIREIQRGHKEYLNVVIEKYYKDIYCFCVYLTGQKEEAYDFTQETFLKFIQYVDTYKYRNLKGYLLTLARNICMDYFRRTKGNFTDLTEIEEREDIKRPFSEEVEERTWLFEELKKLPQQQREAIVLFYYGDLKMKEIAAITGTNVSTVKSRIRQGTGKMNRNGKED